MVEPNTQKQHSDIEGQLEALYAAATPDPDFAARLAIQLSQRSRTIDGQPIPPSRSPLAGLRNFFRRPALAAALAAVLLLAAAVTLAGPQKVLAQVQKLLGYAPSAGFVEPGLTRILLSPVEQRQGEVTLRVDSVVADSRQTQVILTASGLPRKKFDLRAGEQPKEVEPYLLLLDGSRLAPSTSTSGIGDVLQASLTFPPLPEQATQITLVLPRLPSLPAGFAPENWSVPLTLAETRSAGTDSAPGHPLGQSYAPENGTTDANGVTVSLLQVGQSQEEIGLQVQYDWEDQAWLWLRDAQLSLADDTGRSYERRLPALGASFEPGDQSVRPGSRTNTYRFAPFDPQARAGVLIIDRLTFSFKSDAKFSFDPGRDVEPGQTWDLSEAPGSRLEVAGLPVQILNAELSANPDSADPDARYLLTLLVQATPAGGRAIDNLTLSPSRDRISSSCRMLPDNRFRLSTGLPESPNRPISLYLSSGEISLAGPWEITWDLPRQP